MHGSNVDLRLELCNFQSGRLLQSGGGWGTESPIGQTVVNNLLYVSYKKNR